MISWQISKLQFRRHLSKKITDLGLKEKYSEDSEFCHRIRSFSSLTFLPVEDVENAYEDLIDDEEIPAEFIAYFDLTYKGVVRGHGAS